MPIGIAGRTCSEVGVLALRAEWGPFAHTTDFGAQASFNPVSFHGARSTMTSRVAWGAGRA